MGSPVPQWLWLQALLRCYLAIIRPSVLISNPDGGVRRAGRARPGCRMAGKAAGRLGLGLGSTPPACPPLPQLVLQPRLHLALRLVLSTPSYRGCLLWEGSEPFCSLSTFLPTPEKPGLHGRSVKGERPTKLGSNHSPTWNMLCQLKQVTSFSESRFLYL